MKNVIITGSSNGFGLKAAKNFADNGYQVFATIRNPSGKNANAKTELESHSTHIKVVDMDVTNDASVKEAMASILAAALTQPIQDSVLKDMQLDSVLGGASA